MIKGKRVGLITNPTGVDQNLNSIVDLLFNDPEVELTALYGPEHGVRGDAQAGSYVEYYIDEETGYQFTVYTDKQESQHLKCLKILMFFCLTSRM